MMESKEKKYQGNRVISEFYWLLKFLIATSCSVAALLLFLSWAELSQCNFLMDLDYALTSHFPGLLSLTKFAIAPEIWRTHMCVLICLMPYCWWRLTSAIFPIHADALATRITSAGQMILAFGVLWFEGWLLLFNEKVFDPQIFSRGNVLLTVFHSSYLGLALTAWMFVFFLALSLPLIFKSTASLFGSQAKGKAGRDK